jgi:hypothetical protein
MIERKHINYINTKGYNRNSELERYYKNRPIERTILTILGWVALPAFWYLCYLFSKHSPPVPW